MVGGVDTVLEMFVVHRFIGGFIPRYSRKRFRDINDNLYFFSIVIVTSNICRGDSCFEVFGSKKRGHLLATSYVRRR